MLFRTARHLSVWTLVLTFAGSLVLPALSVRHLSPDADEGPLFLGGRHSPHVEANDSDQAGEHCPICHWLRAISGAWAPPSAGAGRQPAASLTAVSRPSDRQGRSAGRIGPSRAPPATL